MSRSICLRCLSRSLGAIERRPVQPVLQSSFSTSSKQQQAVTAKKKGSGPSVAQRSGGSLKLKKVKRVSTGRPPQPGERRAIRKRIVLSNTNALEVRGLEQFTKDNCTSSSLEKLRGRVLAFDEKTIDALRALQAFKTSQSWSLFRTAATLVRHDTVTVARMIEQTNVDSTAKRSTPGMVLIGERGSGKSVLQLQAMCMAKLKGWILIHFPEAQDLTIGTTSYQPATDASGKTVYAQPHLTAKLLESVLKANETILSTLRLSQKHDLPIPIPENISIARLLQLASRDPSIAWPVWQVLMKELMSASQAGEGLQRPPVLLTCDGLAHIMRHSAYLDPEVNNIHAHELGLVSSFLGYLNGTTPMHNGGLVLAATSGSNRPATPTLDFVLAERDAENRQRPKPVWDPYAERDALVDGALQSVQVLNVGGLAKDEAKGAMEYYALSGILRNSITDSFVAEKWSISGGGVVGELEKSCVRQKF